MDNTGIVWLLILLILVLFLGAGQNNRLRAAWLGLSGQSTTKEA